MKPGDTVKPGQNSGDGDNNQPQQPADSTQDSSPTPPPATPPPSEAEEVTPAAGSPAESAPANAEGAGLDKSAAEEQTEQEPTVADSPDPQAPAPSKGGTEAAASQDPSEEVAKEVPSDQEEAEKKEEQPEAPPEDEQEPPAPPQPPGSSTPPPSTPPPPQDPTSGPSQFSWEASEYVDHHHSAMWYAGLGTVTLGLVAVLVLVVREILSAVVVFLMMVAIAVYARRKPKSLTYSVSDSGIDIGEKFYPFNEFRSFAVVPAQSLISIELDPLKRFMPRISIFVNPQDAEQVANIIQGHLPREDRTPDLVDRLAHALKF